MPTLGSPEPSKSTLRCPKTGHRPLHVFSIYYWRLTWNAHGYSEFRIYLSKDSVLLPNPITAIPPRCTWIKLLTLYICTIPQFYTYINENI